MKKNTISYDDLDIEIKKYLTEDEMNEVKRAYLYAESKHKDQYRRTGEEFIIHPLFVAYILTSIKADYKTLMAALLHDVVEDTDTDLKDVEKSFGEEVMNLVDGVTKINSINISTENEHLTEYYKKIIVGIVEDVRVIIIKLADRLHNMRTLYALPHEKQKKKAKETLEILAPIAHRLGMHKIKSELEDLSLKYLKPEAYRDVVEKLSHTKLERESYVKEMSNELSNLLNANGIPHEIKGRAKSIYSIYKKLDKGRSFNDIYDLLALRILVDKEQECYLALGLIHSKYKPVAKRFKDFIANPKTNLYQTLHTTVFGPHDNFYEIQIRTYDMDEVAENGIASHWAYKENKNAAVEMQNVTEQKLQFYKSIIELRDDKLNSEEFVSKVKNEILNNNIYVYTPKGDVIEMPKDSTPIDFAYRIHSKVGDKMTGAIINNNIASIDYKLKDGDIVKIITNNNSTGPSRSWLDIVTTTSAKSKIKAFFNKTSKENYIDEGKNLLEKELRKKKISYEAFNNNLDKIFEELKIDDLDTLYLKIGSNKHSSKSIVRIITGEKENKEVKVVKKDKVSKSDSDIFLGDSKNIETSIANCCLPVPGDDIVGFITKSKGIRIHKKDCPNIDLLNERVIEATWNNDISGTYYSVLYIHTTSKENIVFDIVKESASEKVTVEKINLVNKSVNNVYELIVLVKDLNMLNSFINKLEKIKYVSDVERINN